MNNDNNATKDRFVNLIKQVSAIDFEFLSSDQVPTTHKAIHQVGEDESIALRVEDRNSLQRAQRRLQLIQAREQQNLEQIFALTATYMSQQINIDRIELDWLMRFNDLAKQVYSSHLQEIWAKIFAIELSSPGSFSFKSIKTLSELSLKEARLLQRAANLLCKIGEDKSEKLITAIYQKPSMLSLFTQPTREPLNLAQLGLSYSQLVTLSELGLLQSQEIESASYKSGTKVSLSYLGDKMTIEITGRELVFTYYKLTQIGQELIKLVTTERHPQFYKQLMSDFNQAIKISGLDNNVV